jgi:hypothetical protein
MGKGFIYIRKFVQEEFQQHPSSVSATIITGQMRYTAQILVISMDSPSKGRFRWEGWGLCLECMVSGDQG